MDIYLDQNHWIALARASSGKEKDKEVVNFSARLLDAVREQKVRIPLSAVNIIELAKIGDKDRRSRLAEVFVWYSQGWVLSALSVVMEQEFERIDKKVIEPLIVIRRGLMAAMESYQTAARPLGVTPEELEALDMESDTPGAWLFALTQRDENRRAEAGAKVFEIAGRYAETVEEVRSKWKEMTPDERRHIFAQGVLADAKDTFGQNSSLIRNVAALMETLPSLQFLEVIAKIPTLDVQIALGIAKTQQWTKKTDPNDVYDIGFMMLAIPYCDVVVTEKLWVDLVNRSDLAEKYNTKVVSNLLELREILEGSAL